MTDLTQLQNALLQQIFARSATGTADANANADADRGLLAYRSHAAATARAALAAAYPVSRQLLGEDSFDQMAPVLWRAHPPQRGDLAQWGGTLAEFLQSYEDLMAEYPFLPDVARLEWQLHQTAGLPDRDMDADSFALIASHPSERLQLTLAPGVCLLYSKYPAASIVLAHRQSSRNGNNCEDQSCTPDLSAAQHKLQQQQGETALVWRQGLRPTLRETQTQEIVFLQAVLAGWSLRSALYMVEQMATVPGSPPATFDFNNWLPQAISEQLVLGCRTVGAEPAAEKAG